MDGIGLFCGPALCLHAQMYVGNITLVLAFKRNSSLRPLVAKNLLAHPSKNQVQKGNKLHLVGMRMCVVRHPALSTYYVQKDILDMPACKTPDFEAAPSRVHSLTTLAYLAWIGWPQSTDPEPDNPNKACSCGCTTNGRPHMRMRQD